MQLISCRSTLLVIVPAKGCVVFASDSRSTVAGKYYDGFNKLWPVDGISNLMFAVTGTARFLPACPPGSDMKAWLQTPPAFDGEQKAAAALRRLGSGPLTMGRISSVASLFADDVNEGIRTKRIDSSLLHEMCRIVTVQYEAATSRTRIASALLRVEQNEARVGDVTSEEIDEEEPVVVLPMGETHYINEYVFAGDGRALLPEGFWRYASLPKIAGLNEMQAVWLAACLIRAAEKRTLAVPAPSGIGGPVAAYVIDGKTSPRRIEPPREQPW